MASKFWIKLYMEILDDPKMGNLPDHLYRRTIELFLLAGDYDKDGLLPQEKDIAWRLRIGNESLHNDVTQLIENGILEVVENVLQVKNYLKWQGEIPVKDRVKGFREREKKRQYYANVTDRYTDKKRRDKSRDKSRVEVDIDDPKVYRDRYTKGKNSAIGLKVSEERNQ